MERPKITLTDITNGQKVYISSIGDTNANIILPIKEDYREKGYSTFTFIDSHEISEIIADKFIPGCILPAPRINYPINTFTGYEGGVRLDPYNASQYGVIDKLTTSYEFSKSPDFSQVIFKKLIDGTDAKNLPLEEMAGQGLYPTDEGSDVLNTYYVRCRVLLNTYSSSWSNVGSFKITNSSYCKPKPLNLLEIKKVNAEELYPYLKDVLESREPLMVRTGELKLQVSEPIPAMGTPGTPDELIIKFRPQTDGNNVSKFHTEKEITVPYNKTGIYLLDLIPHILYYSVNYNVSYKYRNSKNGISSPYSDERLLYSGDQIPNLEANIINFGIVTELSKVSKNKTINLDDIILSDKYVDKYLYHDLWKDCTRIIPHSTRGIQFSVTLDYKGKKDRTASYVDLCDDVKKYINKGEIDYLGHMAYITQPIDEGFKYTLKLTATLSGVDDTTFTFTKEVEQTIPNSDGITGEIVENSPRKETQDGYFGYFGEIIGESKVIPYLGSKSKIDPAKFTQNGSFEYLDNGVPYVYHKDSEITINKKLLELTDAEHKLIYGEVVPTNSSDLYKKLGLKNIKRPSGEYQVYNYDGELVHEVPYTLNENQTTHYIKTYNRGKQLIYTPKIPVSDNITYRQLRSQWLTGNGSYTFRHGKNTFKARLLEFGPSPVINGFYPDKVNTKRNITGDVEMYECLYGNRLANYFMGDLGIAHNTDVTYTNNGWIRTFSMGNTTKHEKGMLEEKNWDKPERLITTVESEKQESFVKNRIGYYRPVLEYLRNSHLPYMLMKSNLPGPTKFVYDRLGDVGYFGKMTKEEFISSGELLGMLNLTIDNLITTDFFYYKFYYRGKIIYIPSKPIIKLTGEEDIKRIIGSGNYFTNQHKDGYYHYKNMRYSLGCLSYAETDYTTTPNQYDEELIYTKPRKLSSNGMFHLLMSRVLEVNLLESSDYTGDNPFDNWETTKDKFVPAYPVLLTDHLDGELACLKDDGTLTKKSLAGNVLSYWPVIITECLDYSNNLNYGEWNVRPGQITYKTVKVTTKTLTPKKVTRTRSVIKTKITEYDKTVVQVVQVPNDKISFPKIPKNSKDQYGLLIFHSLKTDPICDDRGLYEREMLNIKRHVNGGNIIGYSENLPNIGKYIAKSILSSDPTGLCPTPLHVAITFQEAITCKNYVRDLIQDEVRLGVLKNYVYEKPYADNENKYPFGILYGKIASLIAYYPLNKGYTLFNPRENIIGEMNENPIVLEKNGRYMNTWTTMNDEKGPVTVPCLSGMLDFMNFTNEGKKVIRNYALYLVTKLRLPTDKQHIEDSINQILTTYNFGVVGVELDSLHIMKEANGVLTGSFIDPILRTLPTDYRLQKYFTTLNKEGYSSGNDFTDIMHPQQGYDEVEKEVVIKVPVATQYVDEEIYEEMIYEEVTSETEIQVPVYSYSSN